jgi:hypothetical protein
MMGETPRLALERGHPAQLAAVVLPGAGHQAARHSGLAALA